MFPSLVRSTRHFRNSKPTTLSFYLTYLNTFQIQLRTLRNLSNHLEKGGYIIVSVPNVAHFSVSIPLLLGRRFEYQDAGILDRTHLKFFVENTAVKLLNEANFNVIAGLISGIQGSKSKLLDVLSFGALRHHLAKQYIMLGELTDGNFSQVQVRWAIA